MHEFWVCFREDNRSGRLGSVLALDHITPIRFSVGV